MSDSIKPKLDINGQIEHLYKKGVKFDIVSKKTASSYLSDQNYYFKLRSYRKNYSKYSGGKDEGKYINMDFAYLKDLASIDMQLRYLLLHMALDIEHFAKVKLLGVVGASQEDGYSIVVDFISSLSTSYEDALKREIDRNEANPYCGDIVKKYKSCGFPIWAFLEIISFGSFISFYKFCANRLNNRDMLDDFYLMQYVKDLRNASAHSNCILNDLKPQTAKHRANYRVMAELSDIGISKGVRSRKMSNTRIQQIVTLLYTHKKLISSSDVRDYQSGALHSLSGRMHFNIDYYKDNDTISSVFSFIKKIIDNWFPLSVECKYTEKAGLTAFAERGHN